VLQTPVQLRVQRKSIDSQFTNVHSAMRAAPQHIVVRVLLGASETTFCWSEDYAESLIIETKPDERKKKTKSGSPDPSKCTIADCSW
jgi:hypothetical protein